MSLSPVAQPNMKAYLLKDDGDIPNNAHLRLLVYEKVFEGKGEPVAESFEELYAANNWAGTWRWGVYPFHHFHSTAHEVLGCFRGSATVLFGGESGVKVDLIPGAMVVIPAGVGHKKLTSSIGFTVVGGYPGGQDHDLRRGAREDRPSVDRNIDAVPLPICDPVYGGSGPLLRFWSGGAR